MKTTTQVEASLTLGPAKADFALGQEVTLVGGDSAAERASPIATAEFGLNKMVLSGDEVSVAGKIGPVGGSVGVRVKAVAEATALALPALTELFNSVVPDIRFHIEDPENPDQNR
jgi:hypothetical protein